MSAMEWVKLILSVLSGVLACLPLVVKLIEYVQALYREKQWNVLLKLVMELMQDAELMFDEGATRKEWVLSMVSSSADYIDYNIDLEVVSQMIDDLCAMSKVVNAPTDVPAAKAGV